MCGYETELIPQTVGVKQEYFYSDYSSSPELVSPTIDYEIRHNVKVDKYFLFIIDISTNSNELNFSSYVYYFIYILGTKLPI